jgi:peptide deformylase
VDIIVGLPLVLARASPGSCPVIVTSEHPGPLPAFRLSGSSPLPGTAAVPYLGVMSDEELEQPPPRHGGPTLLQGVPVRSYPPLAPEASRGRLLRVTVVGEDVLHKPCATVTDFGTPALHQLIDDMFLTMYAAEGVGLAANQVGVGLRLFVYDCPDDDDVRHVGHVINPVVDLPVGKVALDSNGEGCLSVPGPVKDVARPAFARVRGVDRDGRPVVLEGTGYFARCLQHETDHTNGRLYIDQLSKRERRDALAQMEELRDGVAARRNARAAQLAELFGTGPQPAQPG